VIIGLPPDTFFVIDLAFALSRAAAGAIALVLRAFVLRAEVGDLRKRAIAAIMATIENCLVHVFKKMKEFFERFFTVNTEVEYAHEAVER